MPFGRAAAAIFMLTASGIAVAQAGHTRPDQIVCAISGTCDAGAATNTDRQIPVGQEKSFSLVRPTAAPAAERAATVAPAMRSAPRRTALAARRPAGVKPASGRIEMLVSFPKGSADLTPGGKQEAQAFATAMASPSLQGMHFVVQGHTDAAGSRDYNLDLSKRRAQSVVDYLVSQGADRSRLNAQGVGFDQPRPGLTPRDPGNRRVEFIKAA